MTSIGYFGEGTLNVMDAQIVTGQTSIGRFFGSSGVVEIKGDEGKSVWTYSGEFRVGDRGAGILTITSGSLQSQVDDDLYVGCGEDSTGLLIVDGIDSFLGTFGRVDVGTIGGGGRMFVMGGATVEVGSFFEIGAFDQNMGSGEATVQGEVENATGFQHSRVQTETLAVGRRAAGSLTVKDGGRVNGTIAVFGDETEGVAEVRIGPNGIISMTEDIVIGQEEPPAGQFAAGQAIVTLEWKSFLNFAFLIGDQIFLGPGGSQIQGTGIVRAHSGFFNNGGIVSTGITILDFSKQATIPRPLTFESDFTMTGGTLEIGVFGLGANQAGVIEVTGEADIQSATIHFVFQNGFLPKTNDQIPFLMTEGGLTVGTLNFTYEGAAPGFLFGVTEENGMLMFEAMNDAQPLPNNPMENSDLNGDDKIDVHDLLLFLEHFNQ